MLDAIMEEARAAYKRDQDKKRERDHRDRCAYKKWDREKKHFKKAFSRIRANYRPPTSSIRDPAAGGAFTFDQGRIHQLFMDEWEGVYRRHADPPPPRAYRNSSRSTLPTCPKRAH